MIIFKDIITNDEMFTDSSKYKVIDDCLYEVECRQVTRKQGDIQLDGANPSAEEADEGTDEAVESGLDVVLNQRLCETGFKKSEYMAYLKTYVKALVEKWKEMEWTDQQMEDAKKKITEAVKLVRPKLDDVQFFTGESCNPDGMVALLEYRNNDDGTETPYLFFYKHGIDAEKV